jgi:hypothetical protein
VLFIVKISIKCALKFGIYIYIYIYDLYLHYLYQFEDDIQLALISGPCFCRFIQVPSTAEQRHETRTLFNGKDSKSFPSSLLKKWINSDRIRNFINNTYFTVHRREWKDYMKNDILHNLTKVYKLSALSKQIFKRSQRRWKEHIVGLILGRMMYHHHLCLFCTKNKYLRIWLTTNLDKYDDMMKTMMIDHDDILDSATHMLFMPRFITQMHVWILHVWTCTHAHTHACIYTQHVAGIYKMKL